MILYFLQKGIAKRLENLDKNLTNKEMIGRYFQLCLIETAGWGENSASLPDRSICFFG